VLLVVLTVSLLVFVFGYSADALNGFLSTNCGDTTGDSTGNSTGDSTGNSSGECHQDTDGDGVEDVIDAGDGEFQDGVFTTGSITDRGGLDVAVIDEDSPAGVRIAVGAGTGQATFTVCGGFTLTLSAGSEAVITCGSVEVEVIEGEAEVVLGDGLTVISVPEGVTAKITENTDGTFEIEHVDGTGDITVTVDGVQTTVGPDETANVTVRDFIGFGAPVRNPPELNTVNAGSSVQFKWRILEADGTPYTDLTTATLAARPLVDCETPSGTSTPVSGVSALQHLGDGFYRLGWKTPKGSPPSCTVLELDIGEGVTRNAYFNFAR
jgi:hypothetical protein